MEMTSLIGGEGGGEIGVLSYMQEKSIFQIRTAFCRTHIARAVIGLNSRLYRGTEHWLITVSWLSNGSV